MILLHRLSIVKNFPNATVQEKKAALDGIFDFQMLFHGKYISLGKVGQGTYSNVYKAKDRDTKKIVALKKVRFDTSEPESVKFMAREILVLKKLDHPNVIKLEGLATSRMQYSLYLVFDFMQSDLTKIISRPDEIPEAQVKCYMQQLLSGLQHCHERGILHRDIKPSNLLIDKNGVLKIADFGLANFYPRKHKRSLTNRVVTLWYRAPELLLGSTDYGVGIDLWSAGCLLAGCFLEGQLCLGEQRHKTYKEKQYNQRNYGHRGKELIELGSGDFESSKEEKDAEHKYSHVIINSASSSSSGSKFTGHEASIKGIINPNEGYKLSQRSRPLSTLDFRNLDQERMSKLYRFNKDQAYKNDAFFSPPPE
ncbi:hypothetical protein SO802_026181 [Lithocarpus litseifolius]|uniref:Protein kinase domain-containing protein n=1 Tax=Lithocarpus litseifolius TaxID=425828 RepID=A0AAW2C0M6_9ROSI